MVEGMGEWRETWLPGQALPADGVGGGLGNGQGVPGGAGLDEAFEQYCCDSLPSPDALILDPSGNLGATLSRGWKMVCTA